MVAKIESIFWNDPRRDLTIGTPEWLKNGNFLQTQNLGLFFASSLLLPFLSPISTILKQLEDLLRGEKAEITLWMTPYRLGLGSRARKEEWSISACELYFSMIRYKKVHFRLKAQSHLEKLAVFIQIENSWYFLHPTQH